MVSNEELLTVITELKAQVQRMADALQKKEDRKNYHSEYYKKRKTDKKKKAAKSKLKLENPNRHILEGQRDYRLPFKKWALKLKKFVDRGLSPYNFVTWLAWSWNQDTYQHTPITKSGGYMHVFIGVSAQDGGRALRSRYSERDVTGHMRVNTFKNEAQIDTFASALWWKWTFRVLGLAVSEVDEEDWYNALGESWHRPMKVLQGATGLYEIQRTGAEPIYFDPNETDLNLASKMYGFVRPTLEMGWGAALRGFFSKEEPFTEG